MRKGRLIEKMQIRQFGMEIEIRLSKNLKFSAEIGGETLVDTSAEELKRRIHKKAKEILAYNWKPIILIEWSTSGKGNIASLYLEVTRHYYDIIGDEVRLIDWNNYNKFKDSQFNLIRSSYYWKYKNKFNLSTNNIIQGFADGEHYDDRESEYIVDYSEDLYNSLLTIQDVIRAAAARVRDLCCDNKGRKELINKIGKGLLLMYDSDTIKKI